MLIEGRHIPLALVLEGGYGPSHGEAIRHIFLALQGEDYPLMPGLPKSSTNDIIKTLKKIIQ
jgi:acetoin utilization deacetylase AcuC-like enzyme